MGNLINTIKKFVSNKNTVTILGVLLGIVVLYLGYNYRVNQKVKLIDVYYAKNAISSNTQIKEEDLGTVKVNADLLKQSPNIIRSLGAITDDDGELFFVNFDCNVPAGALLYSNLLVSKDEKTDQKIYNMPEGYRYFIFDVDLTSTLGNAIAPDSPIDIYMFADDNDSKMFGKLFSNVKVVDVVDSKWTTTAGSTEKEPDKLLVRVNEEDYRLLNKAANLSGIKLVPSPNNKDVEQKEGSQVSSGFLKTYIESQYITINE